MVADQKNLNEASEPEDVVYGLELIPVHGLTEGKLIVTGLNNIALIPSGRGGAFESSHAIKRTEALVKLNLRQLQENIEQARHQSGQFFRMTLLFSCVGFAIILAGIVLLFGEQVQAGAVTTAAGVIPEVAAGLFFHKDKELRKTIQAYHANLNVSQQALAMIDAAAETIRDETKRDETIADIIRKAMDISRELPSPGS